MTTKSTYQATLLVLTGIWVCATILLGAGTAGATFNVSEEKMDVKFTRDGESVVATLIPRAKSTSVAIRFRADGGRLADVEAMEVKEALHPQIDHKDFKSELFAARIEDVTPGGEVQMQIRSDFFTGSTQYWIFNAGTDEKWVDSGAEVLDRGDLVQEIVFPVQDGGPFDSDGAANGRIKVIGGPKDSFWGYALGTLFIRFFGIFLVLGVLMIGMLVSGRIFQNIEKKKSAPPAPAEETKPAPEPAADTPVPAENEDAEKAAAVATALYLHFCQPACDDTFCLFCPETASWTQQGRERIMNVRSLVLNRVNR